MKVRSYGELLRICHSFDDRFDYLALNGQVGEATFGFDRWINQRFYQSNEWRLVRAHVITRDLGCDLGYPGLEIHGQLLVHHMNPMAMDDIRDGRDWVLDPEFLITTCKRTHNAIHYGDRNQLPHPPTVRAAGDTRLW